MSLESTGLYRFFEPHVFSASDVPKGKPAPDLFLHAARKMGVQPSDCIVVEDSPAGISAATAAVSREGHPLKRKRRLSVRTSNNRFVYCRKP